MKIKNIFKKKEKTAKNTTVEKLEKNQLEKVVGGVDVVASLTDTVTRPGQHKPSIV